MIDNSTRNRLRDIIVVSYYVDSINFMRFKYDESLNGYIKVDYTSIKDESKFEISDFKPYQDYINQYDKRLVDFVVLASNFTKSDSKTARAIMYHYTVASVLIKVLGYHIEYLKLRDVREYYNMEPTEPFDKLMYYDVYDTSPKDFPEILAGLAALVAVERSTGLAVVP